MATTISISAKSGYPTQSVMKISVSFTVTYAATYHTEFDLYEGSTLIDTLYGNSYSLAAGGSKSGLTKTFEDLEPGTTYKIKAYLCNSDTDTRLDVGPATLTFTTSDGRPDDWEWNPAIVQGNALSIKASHWNAFIDRIQEFADYLGVSLSSTTISAATATSGTRMMASQANAARTLISKLRPPTALPAAVSSGIIITAAFMNGLKNSLNSIK